MADNIRIVDFKRENPTAQEEVVEFLQEILDRAKSGEVLGVAVAFVRRQDDMMFAASAWAVGEYPCGMQLHSAAHSMACRMALEDLELSDG